MTLPSAEEYYKNDYPDEDDSSLDDSASSGMHAYVSAYFSSERSPVDEFHEDSGQEDVVFYEDDGDDHDWR